MRCKMGGGGVGAAIGAVVGTVIAPGVGTALGAAIGGSAGSSYDAYRADKSARNWQKKQQAEQDRINREQEAQALEIRKHQINQIREQLGAGGNQYSTQRTGAKGITGSIGGGETLG